MCGLIYANRKDKMPIGKTVLKRYRKQKERGSQGFGYITIDNGKITGVNRFEKEAEAIESLEKEKSSHILFHHRTPTSTPNYKDMTHPIVVKNKMLEHDFYVIHNGVLQNEYDLKVKHEKLGFAYTTILEETTTIKTRSGKKESTFYKFNDSESLAIEVALFLSGKQDKIEAIGTIAFICIETDKKDNVLKIHYGRNSGNPLVVENNRDLFFIKSTGDGNKLDEDIITSIDYLTDNVSIQKVMVGKRTEIQVSKHNHEERYDPYDQMDGLGNPRRTIGFGTHDRDEFDGILSPSMFLPLGHSNGRRDDDRDWMPDEMAEMSANIDDRIEIDYAKYKLTDEYWLCLLGEIEELENDIKRLEKRDAELMDESDRAINQEELDEAQAVLDQKKDESNALEDYLKKKQSHWAEK